MLLDQAIATAVKCHARQLRKHAIAGVRVPYIVHPMEVMKTVWLWGAGEPAVLAAAVLHDVLEDSDITPAQLTARFGSEITDLVRELTHDPRAIDKKAYLERFATSSVPALVIKLADRCCNTRDYMAANPQRAERYFTKAAVLVDTLHRRRGEIEARFNDAVAGAIVADYESLQAALSMYPQANTTPKA